MANLEEYYYKPSVILLSVIGLWPGESTILQRIQKAGFSIVVLSTVIVQLTPFITIEYIPTSILYDISFVIMAMGSILKYYTFIFHSNNLKKITELIKHDWSTIKDDEESKIIIQYASVGKSYTTAVTKFLYPAIILVLLPQHAPWFLDIVAPLNETRSPQYLCKFEVFIDQEKYVHILALMVDFMTVTLCKVFLATESICLMWLLHRKSQFEIYVYRIRKAFLEDSVKMHILDRNARITKIFGSALDIYNRAVLFDVYLRKFYLSYVILLFLGVTSMSVVLYRLSEALETLDDLNVLLQCALVIILEYGYMYFLFITMQQVIDSHDNFCVVTYETNWYEAPVRAQKMLLFAMLRNKQAFRKKIYGILEWSKEGFLMSVKTTFSYFMMLRSMR